VKRVLTRPELQTEWLLDRQAQHAKTDVERTEYDRCPPNPDFAPILRQRADDE
jgi:hypothetical protein